MINFYDLFNAGNGALSNYRTTVSGSVPTGVTVSGSGNSQTIAVAADLTPSYKARSVGDVTVSTANRHVDLRTFGSDITRPYTMGEMEQMGPLMQPANIQTIQITGTGGTFNIGWRDQMNTLIKSSAPIAYNASAATLRTALVNMMNASPQSETFVPDVSPYVSVTKSGNIYTVTFNTTAAVFDYLPTLTLGLGSLTGGTGIVINATGSSSVSTLQSALPSDPHKTMTNLENLVVYSENFLLACNSLSLGFLSGWSMAHGPVADKFYFPGLDVTFASPFSSAHTISLTSSTGIGIDIRQADANDANISVWLGVAVNSSLIDWTTTSTIQLTTSADGTFGTAAYNSAAVAFGGSPGTGGFQIALSSFLSGAGGSFDPGNGTLPITGVLITLGCNTASPTFNSGNNRVVLTALRVVSNGYLIQPLDTDTISSIVRPPVPPSMPTVSQPGSGWRLQDAISNRTEAAGSVATWSNVNLAPMIRSGSATRYEDPADPRSSDIALSLLFNTGSYTSNPGSIYNQSAPTVLQLYFRESGNDPGTTNEPIEVAELRFSGAATNPRITRYILNHGADGATPPASTTDTIAANSSGKSYALVDSLDIAAGAYSTGGGPAPFTANSWYLFRAQTVGSQFQVQIYASDQFGNVGALLYDTGPAAFGLRGIGRVGWWADLQRGNQQIADFLSVSTALSTLESVVFNTMDPVDGASLYADFSQPKRLFERFSPIPYAANTWTTDTATFDSTRSKSGNGSWRFSTDGVPTDGAIVSTLLNTSGGTVAPGSTTLVVDSTAGFPNPVGYSSGITPLPLWVGDKQITYTGMTATSFTGVSGLTATLVDNMTVSSGRDGRRGLASNVVNIDDFNHIDISFNIWVSPTLERRADVYNADPLLLNNHPNAWYYLAIHLVPPGGDLTSGAIGPIPITFGGNTWTRNEVDLTPFASGNTYLPGLYQVWITCASNPGESFWVDNMQIGRQLIEWSFRADSASPYRAFEPESINSVGGLHLPPEEWGTELQVLARSLSFEGWISKYRLVPHYAPLGRVLPQRRVWPYVQPTISHAVIDSTDVSNSITQSKSVIITSGSTQHAINNPIDYIRNQLTVIDLAMDRHQITYSHRLIVKVHNDINGFQKTDLLGNEYEPLKRLMKARIRRWSAIFHKNFWAYRPK